MKPYEQKSREEKVDLYNSLDSDQKKIILEKESSVSKIEDWKRRIAEDLQWGWQLKLKLK